MSTHLASLIFFSCPPSENKHKRGSKSKTLSKGNFFESLDLGVLCCSVRQQYLETNKFKFKRNCIFSFSTYQLLPLKIVCIQGRSNLNCGKRAFCTSFHLKKRGPSGATDNASDYGSEDCRFESCLGRRILLPFSYLVMSSKPCLIAVLILSTKDKLTLRTKCGVE